MFDCITIGDATVDTFLLFDKKHPHVSVRRGLSEIAFPLGEKIPIADAIQGIGGNAANVAVGLATLGQKTGITSVIGDDVYGGLVLRELDERGVDTTLVSIESKTHTRYSVILTVENDRTILGSHPHHNYRLPKLPQTAWIYYSSLGPGFEGLQNGLIRHLKTHKKVRLACNPGSHQLQNSLRAFKTILPFIDTLFINAKEAQVLSGSSDIQKQFRTFHTLGIACIAITDGPRGAIASDGTQTLRMKAFPVKVVATTGAGDAFASGFLAARMQNKTLDECVRWGMANSSGVIGAFGAQEGLLTKKQLLARIQKYRTVRPTLFPR